MKSIQYRKPAAEKVLFSNNDIITTSPGGGSLLDRLLNATWSSKGNDGGKAEIDGVWYIRYKNNGSWKDPGEGWSFVDKDDNWRYWKQD